MNYMSTIVWSKVPFLLSSLSLSILSSYALAMVDTDDDGINDEADNCPLVANIGQWDKDKDSIGNACDLDIDGAPNLLELALGTRQWDAKSYPSDGDYDGDGIKDFVDNCFKVANAGQWDLDGDGIGNKCDDDVDGDGSLNIVEKAAGTDIWSASSFIQSDDFDQDGIIDIDDNCPVIANEKQWDKDNIGNVCDDDIDGDGYLNWQEKKGVVVFGIKIRYLKLKQKWFKKNLRVIQMNTYGTSQKSSLLSNVLLVMCLIY